MTPRNAQIVAAVLCGATLTEVGAMHGITSERVRQIAKKYGARSHCRGGTVPVAKTCPRCGMEYTNQLHHRRDVKHERRAAPHEAAVRERNDEIERLAKEGLLYAEIAQSVGCSVMVVSRALVLRGQRRHSMTLAERQRMELIVSLTAQGMTRAQVATEIGMSPTGVYRHIRMHRMEKGAGDAGRP